MCVWLCSFQRDVQLTNRKSVQTPTMVSHGGLHREGTIGKVKGQNAIDIHRDIKAYTNWIHAKFSKRHKSHSERETEGGRRGRERGGGREHQMKNEAS